MIHSRWLVERAQDADWPPERHYAQVLGAVHNSVAANEEAAAFATRERAAGMRWLLAATSCYALVIAVFRLRRRRLGRDLSCQTHHPP